MPEKTRPLLPHELSAPAAQAPMPGFQVCTGCGASTLEADLHPSETGSICPHCVLDAEVLDAGTRAIREEAMSTLLLPGYIGLALMMLMPILRLFPAAQPLLAVVPLVGALLGLAAIRSALRSDADGMGRTLLAMSGTCTVLVSALGVWLFTL